MRKLAAMLAAGLMSASAGAQQRTYINPLDLDYRYNWEQTNEGISYRTGADPAVVRHKDAYYLFETLADGYWRSTDLIRWAFITPIEAVETVKNFFFSAFNFVISARRRSCRPVRNSGSFASTLCRREIA